MDEFVATGMLLLLIRRRRDAGFVLSGFLGGARRVGHKPIGSTSRLKNEILAVLSSGLTFGADGAYKLCFPEVAHLTRGDSQESARRVHKPHLGYWRIRVGFHGWKSGGE